MNQRKAGPGRYLLYLDVLGFSDIVETRAVEEVYAIVDECLQAFDRWQRLNRLFSTIYFSDTFIFYQEPKGYGDWAFLDVYAIGGMVLSALLAKGIPARGSITFGEFEVRKDTTKKHQVYFGRALIEAYRAELREKWIGITIEPSAWKPFEAMNPGAIDTYASEGAWIRRHDDVLLLNPLIKLRAHAPHISGEVSKPYRDWDAPEFPNDLMALLFVRNRVSYYAAKDDFSSTVAAKYHATDAFLRTVLSPELYDWAVGAADDI
jgi:hypothetical protein